MTRNELLEKVRETGVRIEFDREGKECVIRLFAPEGYIFRENRAHGRIVRTQYYWTTSLYRLAYQTLLWGTDPCPDDGCKYCRK